jgi:predicted lipoprotein with Yx(FWY)xxD motif
MAFAVNVLAAPQADRKVRAHLDGASAGQTLPGGPLNTTMSPANDCSAPHPLGVLGSAGGYFSGDTYLAGNDFTGVFDPDCGYQYPYGSGHDEIWEFQVDSDGRWTFDTCTIPAGWDTSLGLYLDIEIGCPGIPWVCNGDDPCGYYYESAIRDVCLQAGNTYWLVVDGWSPTYAFAGTYYDVTYARTTPPCTSDEECDDGDLCNGIETCELGCCMPGEPYCERWEVCVIDPGTGEIYCNGGPPCVSWYSSLQLPGSFSPQCYNGCDGSWFADDVQLHPGTGHELIGYQSYSQARNVMGAYPLCDQNEPLGSPYSIAIELWSTLGGGECVPEALIPGTECTCEDTGVVMPGGSGADICLCEPNGGMPTGITLPTADEDPVTGQCGVDFFFLGKTLNANDGGGFSLATHEQFMGGPALDDEFGQSVVAFEECGDPDEGEDPDEPQGTWGFGAFSSPTVSDHRGLIICSVPWGPCCFHTGGCEMLTWAACDDRGGHMHAYSDPSWPESCEDWDADFDGDGVYFECDNCPDVSNPGQEDCDGDGVGDACEGEPAEQDDDNDGCCNGVDECDNDPAKCQAGQCGCNEDDLDSDGDCDSGLAECAGYCMDCVDECNSDPNACVLDEFCGCPAYPYDWDGDGVPNCEDQCPGIDDAIFGPGGDRATSCVGAIPTVSTWGLAILGLLLLVAGKVRFRRRAQLCFVLCILALPGVALAQTNAASARNTSEKSSVAHPYKADFALGEAARSVVFYGEGPGPDRPETTPRSPMNDCSTVLDAGVLPVTGGVLSGDTYLAGDDFGYFHPDDCYRPEDSGNDEIWEFTVETGGRWAFDTCTIPAGWETTLVVREDDLTRDVCLQGETTYWLVVDGWSPAHVFPGGTYDVTFSRTQGPCTTDADCDDGDMCTGIDTCVDGCCVVAEPCERWEDCDPATQTCFNRYDPCVAWATDETLTGSFSPQCYNGCTGSLIAEDIQLHPGAGHELISYQVYTQARNVMGAYPLCDVPEPLGSPYDITTKLLTTEPGGGCWPEEVIPGTRCDLTEVGVVMESGSPGDVSLCEPNGGLPTGIVLPTGDEDPVWGQCGIDFYLGLISWNDGAGASLTWEEQFLGGPAIDDEWGQSDIIFEDCDGDTPTGNWSISGWGFGPGDMRGVIVCTVPSGPCCFPAGGCEMLSEFDCADQGGTLVGLHDPSNPLSCEDEDGDPDDDNIYFTCDNCPDLANADQRDCNDDGEGDACDLDPGEQDNDNDGCCDDVDECDDDPAKCEAGQCGCGNADMDSDGDCASGLAECEGHCMDCVDECNNDPNACVLDDFCGCPAYPYDWDGDGVPNCEDHCPGIDDAVFGPDGGRHASCVGAIPTVSEWALMILALLLLVAGKVYFGSRVTA